MRTLPGGIPITDAVTRPVQLLTLSFPTTTIRYSNRETVTISGVTYTAAGFTSSVRFDARGQIQADVTIPSHDGGFRTLILASGDWRGRAATLAIVYGESGWTSADIVTLLEGEMDAAPEIGNSVRLTLRSTRHATEFAPRHVAGPPFCNHIPPAGSRISWGTESVTLGAPKAAEISPFNLSDRQRAARYFAKKASGSS